MVPAVIYRVQGKAGSEGGIREAAYHSSPGKAQGIVCNTPMVSTDFYPTMLELAGLPAQAELHADGRSLVPLLDPEPKEQTDALYWHYPHYHGSAGPQEEQYERH